MELRPYIACHCCDLRQIDRWSYRLPADMRTNCLAGQVLERRWFAGRRCLDIGCNEGLVTLAVAARFGAASMLGVDLDEHLIRNACRQGPPCCTPRRLQGVCCACAGYCLHRGAHSMLLYRDQPASSIFEGACALVIFGQISPNVW